MAVVSELVIFIICRAATYSEAQLITGRNEVVAKVIFLHLFVILFTGGVWYLSMHRPPPPGSKPPWSGSPQQTPPREQTPPRAETPPPQGKPSPRSRHPPQSRQPPRQQRRPHLPEQTPGYSQRVAGTHPTGMHSCFLWQSSVSLVDCL